ncbi:hypothetical protein [Croceicoccus marinus]|jgi:hypothetical protein|uniref:hypothetical protein n=1 Tax=Croceicoccus marinus TaxID=450378 RepID=UPI003CC80FED
MRRYAWQVSAELSATGAGISDLVSAVAIAERTRAVVAGALIIITALAAMTSVSTVSTMHKHVEQRAGQQKQSPGKNAKRVNPMLGKQEIPRNRCETEEDDRHPPSPSVGRVLVTLPHILLPPSA